MPLLAQNLLVLSLVACSVAWVGRQAFHVLRGRRSKIGSCCAKGCAPPPSPHERVQFIPIDLLSRKKQVK